MTSPAIEQDVVARGLATSRVAARTWLPLAAFAAVYLAATGLLAHRRPVWNDELYTYYFARLPGIDDLWRALETGADQAPPLSYLTARASLDAFGEGALALRLPAILGFLLFSLCTYAFVARRTSRLYGLVAMILPAATSAYYYASEARAYALVLGFAALALLCWQAATDGGPRRLALPGLFAALALAAASHYYAVLVLLPLALGELVRTRAARRVDLPVWAAFAGGLVPLAAFAPLIDASRGYSAGFWGRPSWGDPLRFFSFLLDPRVAAPDVMSTGRPTSRVLIVLAILVLLAALAVLARNRLASSGGAPAHEVMAVAGFLLVPLAAVVLAETVTNAYAARYALPGVLGLTLIPLALHRVAGGRPAVGVSAVAVAAAAFAATFVAHERAAVRWSAEQRATLTFLQERATGRAPVLLDNPHVYLELSYAAPSELARRFVYVADPDRDSTQRSLLNLGAVAGLPVHDRDELGSLPAEVWAYAPTHVGSGWSALAALEATGRTAVLRARHGDYALYAVSSGDGP